MLEGCLRQMTFILPRLGEYSVSIIHINSSTIAISIVEPQNDADTFINSCGETGERPAIRVMVTINDVWVTAQVNNDAIKKVNIEAYYSDDSDGDSINIYDILLAIAKPKINDIKADAVSNALCGISRFAANNGVLTKPFGDVLNMINECAETRGVTTGKLIDEYANM